MKTILAKTERIHSLPLKDILELKISRSKMLGMPEKKWIQALENIKRIEKQVGAFFCSVSNGMSRNSDGLPRVPYAVELMAMKASDVEPC